MFGVGYVELSIISILAILIFGNRLPGICYSLGSSFVKFKEGLSSAEEEVTQLTSDVKNNLKDIEAGIIKKDKK